MNCSFTKLQNEEVESSLQPVKDAAIGSAQMLSSGFNGIIDAFQAEMRKSRKIQEKMDQNTEKVKRELELTREKCTELTNKLELEIKKMKKCLSEHSLEIDRKLLKFKDEIKKKCDGLKKECSTSIKTIDNKVDKTIKNLDRLQETFENLDREINDELRALSIRCEENNELILAQDNKYKDELNELQDILHDKGIELDNKIENCLNEAIEKVDKFDEKQQNVQFNINKELTEKADIQDLKHKLDITQYENFIDNVYNSFNDKISENIKSLETNLNNTDKKQTAIFEDLNNIKTSQLKLRDMIHDKFTKLCDKQSNAIDIDIMHQKVMESVIESQEAFKQDIIELIQESLNNNDATAFGSKSANFVARGRGYSGSSQAAKLIHGATYSRDRVPSRRRSGGKSVSGTDELTVSEECDKLVNQEIMTSPKEDKVQIVESNVVHKIPDVNTQPSA